jgi:hypothetical protein
MATAKKQLDPHAVAARILPKLDHLALFYKDGIWRTDPEGSYPRYPARINRGALEAIVSRLMRVTLDEMGDTERPVTSNLVREVILALASLCSFEAAKIVQEQR